MFFDNVTGHFFKDILNHFIPTAPTEADTISVVTIDVILCILVTPCGCCCEQHSVRAERDMPNNLLN